MLNFLPKDKKSRTIVALAKEEESVVGYIHEDLSAESCRVCGFEILRKAPKKPQEEPG